MREPRLSVIAKKSGGRTEPTVRGESQPDCVIAGVRRPREQAAQSAAHCSARVAAVDAKAVIRRSRTGARHEDKRNDGVSDGQRGRTPTLLMTTENYRER